MTAIDEILVHVDAMKETQRSVRPARAPWRCFADLFRKPCHVERAVVEQLYLVELSTGRLLQQQLQPLATDDEASREEARRISSMVTYFLAFFRHPEQLSHYAKLGQIRIENRTYGICASANLVLLSVIRGNAGVQVRLTDCRDIFIDAESQYVDGRRDPGEWLPPF
ncbi:MAG: hypothetical protein FWD53_03055 [Phycisphaerales bacterium]|nr:hypothetical protein [Phycisphaerales bacterium]